MIQVLQLLNKKSRRLIQGCILQVSKSLPWIFILDSKPLLPVYGIIVVVLICSVRRDGSVASKGSISKRRTGILSFRVEWNGDWRRQCVCTRRIARNDYTGWRKQVVAPRHCRRDGPKALVPCD